jgi:peptidoglycan/xylan/chitin deacetylase (PgdA/CDA1 family)
MTTIAPTLLYHDTVANNAYSASGFRGAHADHYKLPVAAFTAQLGVFSRQQTACTFTFDDCGVSAIEQTASLLEHHGLRGHFFAPTDYIGQPGFCTPSDLRELAARGHQIGSHSRSHPIPISGLSDSAMVAEWRESRTTLEDWLGQPILSASVPGGFYSERLARIVGECGYRQLYTSTPRRSVQVVRGLEVIGRFCITRATNQQVIEALASGASWPWHVHMVGWQTKALLKTLGGRAWFNARQRAFAFLAKKQR